MEQLKPATRFTFDGLDKNGNKIMVWHSFDYKCSECGKHITVQASRGVEGPPTFKTWVPIPLIIGCDECKSFMTYTGRHRNLCRPVENGYLFVTGNKMACLVKVDLLKGGGIMENLNLPKDPTVADLYKQNNTKEADIPTTEKLAPESNDNNENSEEE